MIGNIISISGSILMVTMGLIGLFNKQIMDNLGFHKLNKRFYRNCVIVGILLFASTLVYNIL